VSLPGGWTEALFSDLTPTDAPIIYGILQPGPNVENGVPYVRPTEISKGRIELADLRRTSIAISKQYTRSLLKTQDLILSIVGTIGKVAEVPPELEGGNITQSSCRIRIDPTLAKPKFVGHFLRSKAAIDQFQTKRLGTAVPRLNIADIRRFLIRLPPILEQHRITEKLDVLTARLARARAELDRSPQLADRFRLSALRAGVMGELTEDWRAITTNIVPVETLLLRVPTPQQGRGGRGATDKIIPGAAGLAVNDPGTILPNGWKWVALLRLAKQETGHTPSRSQPSYWDGGVPWIGIRDAGAHHGRYIEESIQKISEDGLSNSSARLLPAGTVCLSRTASVGYVTIMGQSMATSQDFATWTCTEALLPEYLMYALMAEGDDLRKFGMGSTHTTIYFPEIRAFHIALPPVEEQREIIVRIKQALVRADRLEAEAARGRALLDRLETAILAKAFNGNLVPQDPNDEPASVLLDRVRAQRASAPKAKHKPRSARRTTA
jgi:restriction endonuclease S subunit